MTFEEWFAEQYPNADLSESSVVAVKDKMWGAWCAALEWGTRPTSHNSKSMPCCACCNYKYEHLTLSVCPKCNRVIE